MRLLLALLTSIFLFGSSLQAQIIDFEAETYCMIDSIARDTVIQFVRIYSINTGEFRDKTADLSDDYTPMGDVRSCGSKDRELLDKFCFILRERTALYNGNQSITGNPAQVTAVNDSSGQPIPLPNYPYEVADTALLEFDVRNYLLANDIVFEDIQTGGSTAGNGFTTITLTNTNTVIPLIIPSFPAGVSTSTTYFPGDFARYIDFECNVIEVVKDGSEKVDEIPPLIILERVNCNEIPCEVLRETVNETFTNFEREFDFQRLYSVTVMSTDSVRVTINNDPPVTYPPGSYTWTSPDDCRYLRDIFRFFSNGQYYLNWIR